MKKAAEEAEAARLQKEEEERRLTEEADHAEVEAQENERKTEE